MRSLALGIVLAAAMFAADARAGVIEQFEAEDWGGLAYADDASGAFHNCIVFAAYRNGVTLMMIRTVEDAWTLALAHDDWRLTPGSRRSLQYKVDRRRPVQAEAEVLSAGQLSIAADDRLIDRMRRGRLLTIAFDGTEYGFELSNSAKALKAVEDCVERHRGRIVQAAAPATGAEQPAGDAQQAAATAESAQAEVAEADSAAATADAATLGERQDIGHWAVMATDDDAGDFANCTAFGLERGYEEQLILSYTPEGQWELGLYSAGWSLDTAGSYVLWYNVDRSVDEPGVIKRPVEAVEPTRIFFEVSALETLMERAAGGRQLHLRLHGPGMEPQDMSYALDRAGEALAATRSCVAQHLAQAGAVAAGGDPAPAPDAAAALVPESGDEPIEIFEVPGWNAAAWGDKAGGAFAYCSIGAEYQNGATLGFLRKADDSLVMMLVRGDWSLRPGEATSIRYQVTWETAPNVIGITGGGLERYGEAEAVDAATMAIEIGSDEFFMERLRQAQRLSIETEGMSLVFNIDDLPPGLEAIDACRERHLAALPAPSGQAAAAPATEETAAQEGARYVAELMMRSGYLDLHMLVGGDRPDGFQHYDVVWEIGEIVGMLAVQPAAEGLTLTQVRNRIIADDAASCEGAFATGTLASLGGGAHLYSACKTGETELSVFYAVVPRQRGGFYVVMHIGIGDGAAARAISGRVYQTALL